MLRYSVAFTGYIAGMGADHIKHRIPHRFEGGNGTPEIYPTEDGNEVAILSRDRHCTLVVEEVAPPTERGEPVETTQEAVRAEAETPSVQEEAEKPEAASEEVAKYTREEVIASLKQKHYQDYLRPMADECGVKGTTEAGKAKKKTVLVKELADAYMARQNAE